MKNEKDEKVEIEKSSAPLLEHLIELRRRLFWAVVSVVIFFILSFVVADKIFEILIVPFERAASHVENLRLIYTAPQEYFFAQLRIALFASLFISFPIIAIQLYRFISPGLYIKEKRAFLPFLIATPILFLAGSSLVYFIIMPLAMTFFLSMQSLNPSTGATIELLPKVSEYLSLMMTLIFAFGFVFQLPVVIAIMARAGLVASGTLKSARKYAIVLTFIAAAILTPPDPISQIGLAVPTLLLYEISIWLTIMIERKKKEQANV